MEINPIDSNYNSADNSLSLSLSLYSLSPCFFCSLPITVRKISVRDLSPVGYSGTIRYGWSCHYYYLSTATTVHFLVWFDFFFFNTVKFSHVTVGERSGRKIQNDTNKINTRNARNTIQSLIDSSQLVRDVHLPKMVDSYIYIIKNNSDIDRG